MIRKNVSQVLVAAGMFCASGQMFATEVVPGGGTTSPIAAGSSPSGPALVNGTLIESFFWSTPKPGATTASGDYDSSVYAGPPGTLDFYYQIQNTTTAPTNANNTLTPSFVIGGGSFFNFSSLQVFQVDSTSDFDSFNGTTADNVTSVSLSPAGNLTVNLSGTGLEPGQSSSIVLVQATTSLYDQQGFSTFSWKSPPPVDSFGNATSQVFGNANIEPLFTPEPQLYGVLSLGLAGLFFAVRRRSSKVTPLR